MNKQWRPKDWTELRLKFLKQNMPPPEETSVALALISAVEVGADAMLAVLREKGTHFDKDEWTDDATFETEEPGTVIFIPDEKES